MIHDYVFTIGHGLLSFIKLKGLKFSVAPPYAAGTPQYSLDSGTWLNMVVNPAGGWKIPGALPDDGLAVANGPHDLRVRDDDGEFPLSDFTLLSLAAMCLSSETLTLRVSDQFVAMSALLPFQEYSLDGGAATPINNDPFQIFELSNLNESYTLAWIVTGAGACTGPVHTFYNPEAAPPPPSEAYPGQFGIKIPWQYWLPLAGVPDEFFDDTLPNNGQNLNSSNYSEKQGFETKVAVYARVRKDGIDTIYEHKSQPIIVSFYQEEPPPVDSWVSCAIETFNSEGDSLGGGILLNGEATTIKATFVPVLPIDINQYYGVVRLQETEQPGENIWEASTLHGVAPGSPIGPCTKAEVGGALVLTCDTVPENLASSEWTISAKVDLGADAELGDYYHQDYSPIDYL